MQLVKVWKDSQGNVDGWMAYDHHYCFASRDGLGASLEGLLEAIEYSWTTYLDGVSGDCSFGFFGGNGQVVSLPDTHEEVLDLIADLVIVAVKVIQEVIPGRFQEKMALAASLVSSLKEVKESASDPSDDAIEKVKDLLIPFLWH